MGDPEKDEAAERTEPMRVGLTPDTGEEITENIFHFGVAGDAIQGTLRDVRPFKQRTDKEGEQTGKRYALTVGKEEYVFFGSAELDRKLETVAVGTAIRITLKGREKLEGGRTLKRYAVETFKPAAKPA